MNVLFLTDTRFVSAPHRDSSTRYRCYHLAEALQKSGHLADVTLLENFDLHNLSRYDIVSVLKPIASRKLLRLMDECRRLNIKTVADVDELIFDPTLAEEATGLPDYIASADQLRGKFMRHSLALQHFDELTVATASLAQCRGKQAPWQPAHIVPNGLSSFWLERNSTSHKKQVPAKHILHMPDSRSSEQDFEVAQQAISTFMADRPDCKMILIGALSVKNNVIADEQIIRGPWIENMELPSLLSDSWIHISPHRTDKFSPVRTHTRFIESAAFGVPFICSPSEAMSIHRDVDGLFIAETPEDWLAALTRLADDEFYQHCNQRLREYAQSNCNSEHIVADIIERWSTSQVSGKNENTAAISKAG